MQEYHEFMRELRAAASHIGERLNKEQACRRLNDNQVRKLKAQDFMTSEFVECRALAGIERGPLVAEISHGVGIGGNRVIGITVFHVLPEYAEFDHAESGLADSIGEMKARLSVLNGSD